MDGLVFACAPVSVSKISLVLIKAADSDEWMKIYNKVRSEFSLIQDGHHKKTIMVLIIPNRTD